MLVGAGDIGSCTLRKAAATAALIAATPGTVFTAGDNAYERGAADEFRRCYDPSWGQFRDRTRPTPGNHDYETPGAAGYFDYFGSQAGRPKRPWYAYNLGAWRIYALNSNCEAIGGCERGSRQQRWLAADLRGHPARCVAAIWHHPLFSSGAHGNDPITRDLWRTLQAAGADLVLTGHDHDYERFARQDAKGRANRNGIREFVVGTGGAERRRLGTVQPHSQALKAGIFGVLKLTLRRRGYAWEYLAAAGSTFEDRGRAACN